jgi:hypothetical protein
MEMKLRILPVCLIISSRAAAYVTNNKWKQSTMEMARVHDVRATGMTPHSAVVTDVASPDPEEEPAIGP